jgi:phage antirepressor YoqD-like protein
MFNTPQFDRSIFEVNKEQKTINLTKIAKYFGKDVRTWLKQKRTQDFLKAYNAKNSDATNPHIGLITSKGGNGEQGTFADRRVTIKFAEWISPEFEVWANEQIEQLLTTGKVELSQSNTKTQQILLPQNYEQALEHLLVKVRDNRELVAKIEQDKPNVEFAEQLLDCKQAIDFALASKVMKLPFGRNILFEKCRDLRILDYKNIPYQQFVDSEYFVVKPKTYTDYYGEQKVSYQTQITAKGQKWLLGRLGVTQTADTISSEDYQTQKQLEHDYNL